METAQIILRLINSIQKNPSVIQSISWRDIRLCITIELQERSGIYAQPHMQTIGSLFNELLDGIEQSSTSRDITSLLQYLRSLFQLMQVLPDVNYIDSLSLQANFNSSCLKHYKNNTIIVLGDSHVNFFSGNESLSFLPIGHSINTCVNNTPCPFTALHMGPCLAYTSDQTNSTSHFRENVEYLCQNFIRPDARIICSLGEIDLRVHVFRQTEIQNRPYQQIVKDILSHYLKFLILLKDKGYNVYCWGPVASQGDSCPPDPNFPRNGCETDRNKATAYFNEQLYLLCQQHGIGFMSIFDKMITSDYRTMTQYLSSDQCHLSQRALPLAKAEWKKVLHL